MADRCWPLPKEKIRITSRFAGRINPVTGRPENHSGTDFAAPDGTPFHAVADGTVTHIGPARGYGQWIVIDHPASAGGGCSEYGHMWNAFATGLKVGDKVRKGQVIGYVGSNGQSTGPHLHLTIWEYGYGGRRVDPESWLAGAGYPGGGSSKVTAPAPKQGRDYLRVEPDLYALLPVSPARFTRGRRAKIEYITRHHTAGKLDAAVINRVWRDREASAHYLVDPTGKVSQHVNDADTAWSNASAHSNARSISIEHSNDGGPDWSISDETIINGARWAAALCLFYGLGRPVYGRNIRDHKEFSGTSCPYHLAKGGKYHDRWMAEAQRFYDELSARKTGEKPIEDKGGESVTFKQFTDFIKGYFGPQIDALQEVWTQLRGPGGRGWAQLGVNERGENLTLVDGVAALRQDVAELSKKIDLMGEK